MLSDRLISIQKILIWECRKIFFLILVEGPEIAEQVQGMHVELTKSVLMSAGIIIREPELLLAILGLRNTQMSYLRPTTRVL